jgi:hypothetical protein
MQLHNMIRRRFVSLDCYFEVHAEHIAAYIVIASTEGVESIVGGVESSFATILPIPFKVSFLERLHVSHSPSPSHASNRSFDIHILASAVDFR